MTSGPSAGARRRSRPVLKGHEGYVAGVLPGERMVPLANRTCLGGWILGRSL
jgi:hypothetical protein